MAWYSKYLSVYDMPIGSVPLDTISEVSENLKRFNSQEPLASIVVIAHNEEKTLLSCLWSLSENACNFPVEVIGVNNNSSDRTGDIFNMLGVRFFFEEKESCGYARQCGLENAQGKYYISIDSDIMYPPDYIQTMIDFLREPAVVAVSSRYGYIPKSIFQKIGFTVYEFFRDVNIRLLSYNRPEISVRGGVFGYQRELGHKIGYRVELKLGEDGSMAIGLKQFGNIKLIFKRRARAVTFIRTPSIGGYLFGNFKGALRKALKSPGRYFTSKTIYKDESSNLIGTTSQSRD